MVARNHRIARIRAQYAPDWRQGLSALPIPADETRECVAYDDEHKPIGRFAVIADDCLTHDTICWRGWFWNLTLMGEAGSAAFPQARTFGFDDNRPLSGIR